MNTSDISKMGKSIDHILERTAKEIKTNLETLASQYSSTFPEMEQVTPIGDNKLKRTTQKAVAVDSTHYDRFITSKADIAVVLLPDGHLYSFEFVGISCGYNSASFFMINSETKKELHLDSYIKYGAKAMEMLEKKISEKAKTKK